MHHCHFAQENAFFECCRRVALVDAARSTRRIPVVLRPLLAIGLLLMPILCAASTIYAYQFDLGPPPDTVADALVTRRPREAIALRVSACAQEVDFLHLVVTGSSDEGIVQHVLAKVAWLARGEPICRASVSVQQGGKDLVDPAWAESFVDTFHCAQAPVVSVNKIEPLTAIELSGRLEGDKSVTKTVISFEVTSECMKRQVNVALAAMKQVGQPGSAGLPCHLILGDAVKGDWDVNVRDLVRIYHLSKNGSMAPGGAILDPGQREHIFNDLLSISGAPWPDDYPLSGCGDTEHETGTPADRADERSWGEENFGWLADVWDVLKWFLLAILIIFAILLALALLFYALGAGAAFSVAAWLGGLVIVGVAVGALLLPWARVPETENHLLMINTSRYLINEMIIEANPTDVHFYVEDQAKVKAWLLARLQKIASHDFEEYNARPYQRYSIIALLNLHDFVQCNPSVSNSSNVKDCDLKTATQIVLDLATAKYAAGSSDGRRSAPFRRLLDVVEDDVLDRRRFTDSFSASDYMFGFMLGHAGRTGQLPDHRAEIGAINEMVYPATSRYVPAPAVLSIMLGEKKQFEQAIHHAGYEIYSRSPSFLVSAGGVRTPSATPGTLGPVFEIGERCVDRGAALPTVLIPSNAGYQRDKPDSMINAGVVGEDLLRIVGFYYHYGRGSKCLAPNNDARTSPPPEKPAPSERQFTWSQDHNLCVFKGFACGTNIVIPHLLEECFTPPDGSPWRFMSSATCPAYPVAKPFYVALFQKACPAGAENCLKDWGFFEAVEALELRCTESFDAQPASCLHNWDPGKPAPIDAAAAYAGFRAKVLALNPPALVPDPKSGDAPALAGRYASPNGHDIDFDAAATMNDKNRPGVVAVNNVRRQDLSDWPLASGDVIQANRCPSDSDRYGRFDILGSFNGVTIDFCDMNKPVWTPHTP